MKKGLTEIVFILDKSGSMSGLEADTIGGYNSFLERQKKEEALERERIAREDQERMLTSGGDRYFYKKKRSDFIWWKKEDRGGHRFSFDKETVFDLMTDYPDKLTAEQKEIFDKENPYWANFFKDRSTT